MSKIATGEYDGIVDFINRNRLQDIFKAEVSGDRSIEEYTEEYEEDHDLIVGIISDVGTVQGEDWTSQVKFKNGHSNKFKITP